MIAAVCAIQNMKKKPYGFKLLKKLHKQMNCFKVSLWHLKEQLIFLNSITTYLVFNEKINYLFLCFCGLATKKNIILKLKSLLW